MNKLPFATLLFLCQLCFSVYAQNLTDCLRMAAATNPDLQTQRAVIEQKLETHREVREFLDPNLFAAGGYGSERRSLPLTLDGYTNPTSAHSAEAQLGASVPIEQGAYLAVGAVGRRRFHYSDDHDDDIFQHLVGVNLKIPLLRDRGFVLYDKKLAATLSDCNASMQMLISEEHRIRHEVEQAFITVCEAQCKRQIARDATERFKKLHDEAQELVRLKSIPTYQLRETLRDLQIGRENEEIAINALELSYRLLSAAIGLETAITAITYSPEQFREDALNLKPRAGNSELERCCQHRGDIQAIISQAESARYEEEYYLESQRDDLSLSAGVNYQGDSTGAPLHSYRQETPRHWGGEVMLTWTRPIFKTGDKARAKKYAARVAEFKARLQSAKKNLAMELRCAELRYDSALRRLQIVAAGVEAARSVVLSEQERFRLGEGKSRDVLDAQKELTDILQRLASAAADALRASSDLQYAQGYPEITHKTL